MEKWFPLRIGVLSYHCWDDGAVVFNRFTGETHQVSLLAVELLTSLDTSQGSTSEDLRSALAEVFFDFDSSESRSMIEVALSQLATYGLLTRALT